MPRTPTLDDPEIRRQYFEHISKGVGRHKAARLVGLDSSTVRRYEAKHHEFAEQVRDAEEAAYEPVHETLMELAKNGDIGAAKEVRRTLRRREVLEERMVTHKLEVGDGMQSALDQIADLTRILQQRRELVANTPEPQKLSRTAAPVAPPTDTVYDAELL